MIFEDVYLRKDLLESVSVEMIVEAADEVSDWLPDSVTDCLERLGYMQKGVKLSRGDATTLLNDAMSHAELKKVLRDADDEHTRKCNVE